MAIEKQYICDGCGEVVHGRMRGNFYHRDYIQFRGQIVLQQNDEKLHQRKYTYLTYAGKLSEDPTKVQTGEELTFCVRGGMPCIEKFLDRRRNEIEYRQRERQENARESQAKSFTSGKPTPHIRY